MTLNIFVFIDFFEIVKFKSLQLGVRLIAYYYCKNLKVDAIEIYVDHQIISLFLEINYEIEERGNEIDILGNSGPSLSLLSVSSG